MKTKESIEIPFGAFDSELKGWEYTIPEGMEAEIKDGKIIVREKESEDERIRKAILALIMWSKSYAASGISTDEAKEMIAWLEKQGEQKQWDFVKPVSEEDKLYLMLDERNLANSAKTCKIEQNPAWSGNDNVRLTSTIQVLEFARSLDSYNQYGKKDIRDNLAWIKSLKDRVQSQPKQEWSEEDEKRFESVLHRMEIVGNRCAFGQLKDDIEWFKSLKERYTWKPNDLPHWKKSTLFGAEDVIGFNSDYFSYKGYIINYKELFERLPKDD